jgi:Putative restriction endonuclease
LALEVSDASLERDRGEKALLYAAAKIGCYWIVNLIDNQIEVHRDPAGPPGNVRYQNIQVFAADATVPFVLDGQEIAQLAVADFLP